MFSREVIRLDLPFGRFTLQKGQGIEQEQISRWVESLTEYKIVPSFFHSSVLREKDFDNIVIQKSYAKEPLNVNTCRHPLLQKKKKK